MKKYYEESLINIKICGIKSVEIVDFLINNFVNYFGLIFYESSPRFVNLKEADLLVKAAKNSNTKPVGVFVDYKIEKIQTYIDKLNLKYIQLHGNEDNQYIKKLKHNNKLIVIKAIGISHKDDLKKLDNYNDADFFLFDYKPTKIKELPGGNAKSFDWNILKELKSPKKWFLSGGINQINVNDALNILNPYGIDISSGVEDNPGVKNINKIFDFLKTIRSK